MFRAAFEDGTVRLPWNVFE